MNFDKLIQRLEEGTSPLRRLYHYTDLVKIAKIVSKNKFELTFAKGADAGKDKNFKRNFYLSCSTIARGRYGTGSEGRYYDENFQALIELDASKISDNYRIIPVDYWSWPEQDRSDKSRIDETEDRIVARNPSIPNAKKYIIAVHIFVPKLKEDEWSKTRSKSYTEAINRIAHSGVDYYIYDDIRYFTLLRKERAHKLESDTHQYELSHEYPGDRASYYAEEIKRLSDYVDWLIDPNANIDEKNRERLERQWNWQDVYSTIDNSLHSDKAEFRPEIRRSIHKLSEYQRKHNKSLQDIVKDAYERARNRH